MSRYAKPGFYGGWGATVPRHNHRPQGLIINKPKQAEPVKLDNAQAKQVLAKTSLQDLLAALKSL